MPPFSIEDALDHWVPGFETISPDGRWAAWVERPVAEDQHPARLMLCRVDDGAPQLVPVTSPSSLCWAPDSRRLLAVTRSGNGHAQLTVVVADTASPRVIRSSAGTFTLARWRPGTENVTAVWFDAPAIAPNGGPPVAGDLSGVFPRPQPIGSLIEVGPDGRERRLLTGWHGHVWSYALSHDGRRVAYVRSPSSEWQNVSTSLAELAIRDLTTGHEIVLPRDVRPTRLTMETLTWSPDDASVAFAGGDADRWYAGHTLFVLDAATGAVRTRQLEQDGTTCGMNWVSADRIAVLRIEGVSSAVYTTDAQLERRELVTDGPEPGGALDFELAAWPPQRLASTLDANAERLCSIWSSSSTPPEVWGGPVTCLRRLSRMNDHLGGRDLGTTRYIEWTSDGHRIGGLFVEPHGAGAGPWPTYVQLHGGPAETWEARFYGNWNMWAQILAGRGIATFMPNFRGSLGRGADFQDLYGRWGLPDVRDILRGVDHAEAEGLADPRHLGIGGWSYGGYATAAVLTSTDRFRAAVIGAGWANHVSHCLTSDVPNYQAMAVGVPISDDPDLYWARSPIRRFAEVRTPTLILHGELDLRIAVSEARAMYQALRLAGCEVELAVYEGEGHVFVNRASHEDMLRRGIAFVERQLGSPSGG
jgi:dipeptidyl aminopeptidase/acylaminoacyl peptidase